MVTLMLKGELDDSFFFYGTLLNEFDLLTGATIYADYYTNGSIS